MKNITLSMDERLLKDGRLYAQKHRTTLNALVRDLLTRRVRGDRSGGLDECFDRMDAAGGRSKGRMWKREDLYDV